MITIRPEEPRDVEAIYEVNRLAFGRDMEADLVNKLRDAGKVTLSLVAVDDDAVVGHVLYSTMTVQGSNPSLRAEALGPIAVLPERQGQGIGSQLMRTSVAQSMRAGVDVIFLVGSLAYYKRFGFDSVAGRGVTSQSWIPLSHLQFLEAWEGAVGASPMTVLFAEEFAEGSDLGPPARRQ